VPVPPDIRYRIATPRDATIIAALVTGGFATYREFAPAGWEPRPALEEEADLRERLGRGDTHAHVAIARGAAAGFTLWSPAFTEAEPRERIPGRAHLSALFIARPHWGTGVATRLLDWSVAGMRDSGYSEAQLWTPRDHGRARAFYEREGWAPVPDGEKFSPDLGLDLVLYILRLG
jgi:GNAT superfamily N-acetyltransferase